MIVCKNVHINGCYFYILKVLSSFYMNNCIKWRVSELEKKKRIKVTKSLHYRKFWLSGGIFSMMFLFYQFYDGFFLQKDIRKKLILLSSKGRFGLFRSVNWNNNLWPVIRLKTKQKTLCNKFISRNISECWLSHLSVVLCNKWLSHMALRDVNAVLSFSGFGVLKYFLLPF